MSDEWRASDQAHASIFELSDLDSPDGRVLPEPAFLRFTASPREIKEYREALLAGCAPSPNIWVPKRESSRKKKKSPSASNDRSLERLRNFRMVPDAVQFRLPVQGQDAANPPPGYFTCFEAFLLNCQLWFPMPRVIVELLDRFELSIGQISPSSLQHIIGILVLGYERGMLLTADYLEAILHPKRAGGGYFYLCPRSERSVVEKLSSNVHDWKDWFFYVRIDEASVEEEGIPFLRTERATEAFTGIPPLPVDLGLVRSLLRGGPIYWGHFSPKRVRRAVAYYSSGFLREGHVEVGADDDSGARERSRSPQERDVPIGQGDCFGEDFNVDDLIDFNILTGADMEELSDEMPAEMPAETPFAKASRLVNKGFRVMNDAVRAGDAEVREAESRAEAAEKEAAYLKEEYDANVCRAQRMAESAIARVREEYEADSRRAVELAEKRVRRARKAGKRHVAAEMTARRERFEPQFMGAADAQMANGVFREQRGIVGGLHLTQDADYSYDAVFAKQSLRLAKLEKKKANLPDLEARMWDQWNPIVVSPDSVEIGADVPDSSGEVNQSWVDPNACQDSISGFYNFD